VLFTRHIEKAELMQEEEQRPLRVRDVFVPGGYPRYTYQDRAKHRVEQRLRDALERLNKFIAVAGPTKSGKTVLVRRVVALDDRVWIEGGHVKTIADVWALVADALQLPASTTEGQSITTETQQATDLESGFRPMGIGAVAKATEGKKDARGKTISKTYSGVASRTAVDALLRHRKVLVIDDFHYLSKDVQSELIRALKPAVFEGLQVVLILIPHRMHEAARAEMDVDGRTVTIPIPEWAPEELFSIGETGFQQLRLSFVPSTLNRLVCETFSSPHLMQDFCSSLCALSGIREGYSGKPPGPRVDLPADPKMFFQDFAQAISPEAFKALRKGPDRTNRKDRALNVGGTCDTYEAVLLALHELAGDTPVDWTRLRRALQAVLRDVPQQHEVTRALEKMDEIAKTLEGEPVIDYVNGELHLVDPFFRYYLKWNTSIMDDAKN
jgi:hypothetical protein